MTNVISFLLWAVAIGVLIGCIVSIIDIASQQDKQQHCQCSQCVCTNRGSK